MILLRFRLHVFFFLCGRSIKFGIGMQFHNILRAQPWLLHNIRGIRDFINQKFIYDSIENLVLPRDQIDEKLNKWCKSNTVILVASCGTSVERKTHKNANVIVQFAGNDFITKPINIKKIWPVRFWIPLTKI